MTVRVGSGVGARIFPDTDWTKGLRCQEKQGGWEGPALLRPRLPKQGNAVWLLPAVSSMAAPLQRDAPSEASSLIHRVPATVLEPGRSWPELQTLAG